MLDFALNRAKQTLQQRFVVWANVRAFRWLLPVSVFHTTISTFILDTNSAARFYFINGVTPDYLIYLSIIYLLYVVDHAVNPVLAIR